MTKTVLRARRLRARRLREQIQKDSRAAILEQSKRSVVLEIGRWRLEVAMLSGSSDGLGVVVVLRKSGEPTVHRIEGEPVRRAGGWTQVAADRVARLATIEFFAEADDQDADSFEIVLSDVAQAIFFVTRATTGGGS